EQVRLIEPDLCAGHGMPLRCLAHLPRTEATVRLPLELDVPGSARLLDLLRIFGAKGALPCEIDTGTIVANVANAALGEAASDVIGNSRQHPAAVGEERGAALGGRLQT